MRMYDIIHQKRQGDGLTDEQIAFVISGYTAGEIPDYQVSALLMAIYFQGMSDRETATLTGEMAKSGDQVDLSHFGGLSVDKHSTGGVGDKTTLIVGPIVASLGAKMAKMSGRGLGHTGGTVDKLESIDGFQIALPTGKFLEQVEQIGLCVVGQSGNLAPADKKLYALRDVTATVDSIPLIAASVMSKKLAAGARNIVLDVKTGSGAFMKTVEQGRRLAEQMVAIGKAHGRNMAALITNMDVPLGKAVGNALEVREAIEVLQGGGDTALRELCVALSANLLMLCHGWTAKEAYHKAEQALQDGLAYECFCHWVEAQGGHAPWIRDLSRFPQAAYAKALYATENGYIQAMDAERIGISASLLGAGRQKLGDAIDYSAGIVIEKKTGDRVASGELLATFYSACEDRMEEAQKCYLDALRFAQTTSFQNALIYDAVR